MPFVGTKKITVTLKKGTYTDPVRPARAERHEEHVQGRVAPTGAPAGTTPATPSPSHRPLQSGTQRREGDGVAGIRARSAEGDGAAGASREALRGRRRRLPRQRRGARQPARSARPLARARQLRRRLRAARPGGSRRRRAGRSRELVRGRAGGRRCAAAGRRPRRVVLRGLVLGRAARDGLACPRCARPRGRLLHARHGGPDRDGLPDVRRRLARVRLARAHRRRELRRRDRVRRRHGASSATS